MTVHRIAAALLVASVLVTSPVAAESASAAMSVSVQVVARAVVSVDSEPQSIEITPADIRRGYVDLDQPIVVRVRTNSRRGYMLQVNNDSETFSTIELALPNAAMTVSSHESWLQRPYVPGGDVMAVRARLHLAPGASAGRQPVPVAFTASPL